MKKVLFNWSGGKDSSLCLYKLLATGDYKISRLITTVNSDKKRISMHGVREELLDLQADKLGLPLYKILLPERVSMDNYDRLMNDTLKKFEGEVDYSVFGDIFLEDLRAYREQRLAETGIKALFPLWNMSTIELSKEFIELGFKAVVACVNGNKLDHTFVGRKYDYKFLNDLPDGVDPCGENGEFHTFVYDGPIFSEPILFDRGKIVSQRYSGKGHSHSGNTEQCSPADITSYTFQYWFCDLLIKK